VNFFIFKDYNNVIEFLVHVEQILRQYITHIFVEMCASCWCTADDLRNSHAGKLSAFETTSTIILMQVNSPLSDKGISVATAASHEIEVSDNKRRIQSRRKCGGRDTLMYTPQALWPIAKSLLKRDGRLKNERVFQNFKRMSVSGEGTDTIQGSQLK
jgi:hypothetical protein